MICDPREFEGAVAHTRCLDAKARSFSGQTLRPRARRRTAALGQNVHFSSNISAADPVPHPRHSSSGYLSPVGGEV